MVVVFLNKYYGQYQMLGDIMRKKWDIYATWYIGVEYTHLKTAVKLTPLLTPSE